MPDNNLSLTLYRQRRSVELLRQQLFAETDLTKMEARLQALAAAEQELRSLGPQEEAAKAKTDIPPIKLGTPGSHGAAGGQLMGAETTGLDVQVLLRMSHIPTGHVHLLDAEKTPLVTYRLTYHGGGYARLRLTSYVEGYSAQSITTLELTASSPGQEVNHLPVFFADRIHTVTELTRAALNTQVDDLDRKTEQQNTIPIWLLARTSAYLSVRDPAAHCWIDMSPYLAAWVTPNAPEVMEVLRRAADLHSEGQIVGYQVGAKGVEEQVRAIYAALKERDIHYVNSVISFGASSGEYMQRVRLPREALENKSANCLDGTILMASLLEAASLNPGIVLIPGHALLAWETNDHSNQWDYLETTMIGTQDFETAQKAGQLLATKQKEMAGQFDDPAYFRLLSLASLRTEQGIVPME